MRVTLLELALQNLQKAYENSCYTIPLLNYFLPSEPYRNNKL